MDELYHYMIRNVDYEGPDSEEPEVLICICPDYAHATHPAFCRACNCWTDETPMTPAIEYDPAMAEENRLLLENFQRLMEETIKAMQRAKEEEKRSK